MPRPAPRGFTLLELLVVVTIIVILISVMVPALERAQTQAGKVKCMGNLRAFSQAIRLYASDHKGDALSRGDNCLQYGLAKYMGFPEYGTTQPVGAAKFMLCPETTVVFNLRHADSPQVTWDLGNGGQGSYGFNLFFNSYATGSNPNLGYPASAWHLKFDKAAGQTPIVGDSNWIGGWPDDDDI